MNKKFITINTSIIIAVVLAMLTGYLDYPLLNEAAKIVTQVFVNLLQLISVPIIFLSIVSTVSGMENLQEFKNLGKRVIKYTLLTTMIAATVALAMFVAIDPVNQTQDLEIQNEQVQGTSKSYIHYLVHVIPSNVIQPFSEHRIISVLFLAILLSLAILGLQDQQRITLHQLFSSLYAAVMKVTSWVVKIMPLAIWSFTVLFLHDVKAGLEIESIALYLACVVFANLFQGLVVLPILVKMKGLSPLKLAKGMLPALSLAFFSKSSSATLPMAMKCAQENLGISKKIANFSFPLCTTINMNGCAAFILTTVLFVSMRNGMTYTPIEMIMWVFVSTIAAVGNAGVPMGCYFLSSAFLAAMDIPLNIMGIILPFYALIDMLETAINVWSDSCVVATVDKELNAEAESLLQVS